MFITPNEQPGLADVHFASVDEMSEFAYTGFGTFSTKGWLLPYKGAFLYRSNQEPRPETFHHPVLAQAANRMISEAGKLTSSIPAEHNLYLAESDRMREMAHSLLTYLSEQPLPGPMVIDLSRVAFPDRPPQEPPTPPDEWITF